MKNMWNDRFNEPGFAYGEAPNDFLAFVAEKIPPGDVLCLAEGEGRNAVYLAELGHHVVAVDQSAVGLAKARKLAQERGVAIETITADLAEYSIEEDRWSGIVSIFCHLPPPLRKKVNAEAVAGLRKGGVLVLEGFTPDQLRYATGGPPSGELLYALEDLRRDFGDLRFEIAHEIVRDVQEGQYHNGQSAVAQILGFRG